MRTGNYQQAWAVSEAVLQRFIENPDCQKSWPQEARSVWRGQALRGRVLVRCHHGLGDTLQFIRYLPLVKETSASLIVKAQRELIPLLKCDPSVDRWLTLDDPDPEFDVEVEVMELPFVFRTTPETVPAPPEYLRSLAFRSVSPSRVGLVWEVGQFRHERSIPFDRLEPLAAIEGVHWTSLQRGPAILAAQRFPFVGDHEAPASITQTAEVIQKLDLVIAVDTMVAHLASNLGCPVWLLLHHDSDWRWIIGESTSAWYPAMRIFRQMIPGDWNSVVAEIASELKSVSGRRESLALH